MRVDQLGDSRPSENPVDRGKARGGELVCRIKGDRVDLEGECVFYMEGEAEV